MQLLRQLLHISGNLFQIFQRAFPKLWIRCGNAVAFRILQHIVESQAGSLQLVFKYLLCKRIKCRLYRFFRGRDGRAFLLRCFSF